MILYVKLGCVHRNILPRQGYKHSKQWCRCRSYIGRYSHKIAISSHRLQSIDDKHVTFSYKDYRDQAKIKTMSLHGPEFLRRFALHILPKAFVKIRHFGIFSSRCAQKLHAMRLRMLNKPAEPYTKKPKKHWKTICEQRLNYKPDLCPCCKKGNMVTVELIPALVRGPPEINRWKSIETVSF